MSKFVVLLLLLSKNGYRGVSLGTFLRDGGGGGSDDRLFCIYTMAFPPTVVLLALGVDRGNGHL